MDGTQTIASIACVFRRAGPVLADRAHVRALRTPREVRHAIAYVLLDARRLAAKAGRRLRAWITRIDPASSGRWLEGWRTPQPRAPDAPAVAPPRTWLLAVGWRRHRLIATPAEFRAARGERGAGGPAHPVGRGLLLGWLATACCPPIPRPLRSSIMREWLVQRFR